MARASIVGWAHTPFGKLEDPDVESLMARVSGEALAHAGVGPGGCRRDLCRRHEQRLFEAGLRGRAGCARPARPGSRSGNTRRERLCDRLGRPLHGVGLHRERPGTHCPGGRRREDDREAVVETSDILLSASYQEGGSRHRRRLRGCIRADCPGLFPAVRRPQRGACPHLREEPQEWRLEPLRANAPGLWLRVLQRRVREESLCGGAAPAHRLLADLRRRRCARRCR